MMSRKPFAVVWLLCVVALCVQSIAVVGAQGRGRGRGQAKKAEKVDQTIVIDRDGHVRVIREYGRGGSLPPGLAKRQALPPGLRKQLRERGELPPGLQKRLIPVPAPLIARLPPVPPNYRRYFAGDDLIIVDTRLNRIAAIIRDVWR
jgi:hypothetical protein